MKIIQLTGKEISEEDEKFIFEIIRKQANVERILLNPENEDEVKINNE